MITERQGARWTAQIELDDLAGDRFLRVRIDVLGRFVSEEAAIQAAQPLLAEWRIGGLTLRDVLLRQLAAIYRHLRERHPLMEPAAVPTTSAAWNRALALWEQAGRLDASRAARYRDHVAHVFDLNAVAVKRHGLLEVGPDTDV